MEYVSPGPSAPKILGRNNNGTLVLTANPSNEAELQLYRVMQRASLLAYYDTLLEMGGDDVQQLCDAGEEEFLEIMALVGMASKPLHVRRLQKALQEWLSNPALFQVPLVSGFINNHHPIAPSGRQPTSGTCSPTGSIPSAVMSGQPSPGQPQQMEPHSPGAAPGSPMQVTPILLESQVARLAEVADMLVRTLPQLEPRQHNAKKRACKELEHVMSMSEDDPRRMDEIRKYAAIYGRFDCKRKPEKPLTLHEVSVNEAAAQICRCMPALLTRRDELFPLARQVVRDAGYHYSKAHSSLSACYRSAHSNGDESSNKRPRLSPSSPADLSDHDSQGRLKRQERLEQIADELRLLGERTDELVGAAQQVKEYTTLQSLQQQIEIIQNKQSQLLVEQNELAARQRFSVRHGRSSTGQMSACLDSDDTDSQLSFSNVSSPSQEIGDSRDSTVRDVDGNGCIELKTERSPCKMPKQLLNDTLLDEGLRVVKEMVANQNTDEVNVQVIASSGSNIIAVANPALSMSPAISPALVDGVLRPPALPILKQECPPSPPEKHS